METNRGDEGLARRSSPQVERTPHGSEDPLACRPLGLGLGRGSAPGAHRPEPRLCPVAQGTELGSRGVREGPERDQRDAVIPPMSFWCWTQGDPWWPARKRHTARCPQPVGTGARPRGEGPLCAASRQRGPAGPGLLPPPPALAREQSARLSQTGPPGWALRAGDRDRNGRGCPLRPRAPGRKCPLYRVGRIAH